MYSSFLCQKKCEGKNENKQQRLRICKGIESSSQTLSF